MKASTQKIQLLSCLMLGIALIAHADETMLKLPAGNFQMGSAEEAKPVHTVAIKAFALAKNLVTRAQFATFVDETHYEAGNGWRKPLMKQGDDDPVVNVSWQDAQAYTDWLSKKTGEHYRLPTEAEWEYAARAGTTSAYWWGEEVGSNRANCSDCGSRWDDNRTAPVGSFAANPWGLFDMGGNAAQWTQDCFAETYENAPIDGSAMTHGDCKYRVTRGGGWNDTVGAVRVFARDSTLPDFRYMNIGFRVAKDLR